MSKSTHKKLTQVEHVLKRPGMYIGSIEKDTYATYIYNEEAERMVKTEIDYVPALYKIYDEIITNVLDHNIRIKTSNDRSMKKYPIKNVKVNIDRDANTISVMNDGFGIPVEYNTIEKMYIPQLIFGNLLTSSSFEDEENITGSVNGIGVKACNIYSKKFTVETLDVINKKKYKQVFEDNMSKTNKPKITDLNASESYPYSKFTFEPDLAKFKIKKIGKGLYEMMKKRVYDIAGLLAKDGVKVSFNNNKIAIKNFQKYAELYMSPESQGLLEFQPSSSNGDRWNVLVGATDGTGLKCISFVNGINTFKGGKHCDYIINQIVKKLTEMISKKYKEIPASVLKPNIIKDNLAVFINCTIVNPAFDSQIKDYLTTPVSKFGSKCELTDDFFKKLFKTQIVENIVERCTHKSNSALAKTDGKKTSNIMGIPKLDDAIWAGTRKSAQTTLILTEGDSAKTFALSGFKAVGRDKYGAFPLRGKFINVDTCTKKQLMENAELVALKKILGLETGKKYTDVSKLRYGRVMILTDQDLDGSHIKGLIINLFKSMWPELLKIKNNGSSFLCYMPTPLVKLNKGKEVHLFYYMNDFQKWKNSKTEKEIKSYNIKYVKGLGTNSAQDAVKYFTTLNICEYNCDKDCFERLNMAFLKTEADKRKDWLKYYDPTLTIDSGAKKINITDFVDKELIHFSNYDNIRSIPSLVDGFKDSHRKIMYGCFKRKLKTDIKVAQLSGYIAEHADYHHGETSLQETIINLAQDYTGSNNLNLLYPSGQFGTRLMNGKDSASARYIFTRLNDYTTKIFKAEDEAILDYNLDDENKQIEPKFYLPAIPMILVNGAEGIGTGYSTNIPSYNPKDLIELFRKISALSGNEEGNEERLEELFKSADKFKPYYRGFKGKITKSGAKFICEGVYRVIDDCKIEITEIPIGVSIQSYKEFLATLTAGYDTMVNAKDSEKLKGKKKEEPYLQAFHNYSDDVNIKFILEFIPDRYNELENSDIIKIFKLQSNINLTNMVAFDENMHLHRYEKISDIIRKFYKVRISYYEKRRKYLIKKYKEDLLYAGAKVRFIMDIIEKRLEVRNTPKAKIEEYLRENDFPERDGNYKYLTDMPIYSLTKERKEALQREMEELQKLVDFYKTTTKQAMWHSELMELDSDICH